MHFIESIPGQNDIKSKVADDTARKILNTTSFEEMSVQRRSASCSEGKRGNRECKKEY